MIHPKMLTNTTPDNPEWKEILIKTMLLAFPTTLSIGCCSFSSRTKHTWSKGKKAIWGEKSKRMPFSSRTCKESHFQRIFILLYEEYSWEIQIFKTKFKLDISLQFRFLKIKLFFLYKCPVMLQLDDFCFG